MLCLCRQAPAQTPVTTIVNAGFETGAPGAAVGSPWTQIAGLGPMYVSTGAGLSSGSPTAPYSGSAFLTADRFAPEPDDPTSRNMGVFQDVDLAPYASLIGMGGQRLELSFAYNDNDANDTAVVSLGFLDGLGASLGSPYTFTAGSQATGNWATASLLGDIPASAAKVRVSLQTTFNNVGTVRNVSYDALSAMILPPAPPAPPSGIVNGNLIQFDGNGAWTWYSDERAIVDPNNGRLLVNSVGFSPSYVNNGQNVGLVDVVEFDPATGRRTRTQLSNLSGVASQNIQRDDHNNGALLVLPDGRYLAMYANHGNTGGLGDEFTRWRRSVNPGDSTSWTAEQAFNWFQQTPGVNLGGNGDVANVSYHNLFYLSAEDKVYDVSRAFGQAPNILRYDMQNNSVAWAGQLADSSIGGYSTGYFKYASNGVDRIYFTHTETHPRNYNTSVYAGYIQNGQSFDMLGNLVDANIFDNETAAGGSGVVPDVTQFTLVQQADPLGAGYNRLWTIDENLDAAGQPMALYISRWNPNGATSDGGTTNPIDHRLHYAHWNPQSGQWEKHEVARMGNRLYRGSDVSEQDYTGAAALVPGDPSTIYISTPYDPRDASGGTFTTSYEIYKGVTGDGGVNWSWTAITENSVVDNLRPIVPDPHGGDVSVLWFRGTYTTAHAIDAAVVGIVERSGETQGLVQYFDATAANTMYAAGGSLQTSTPSAGAGPLDNLWHERTGVGNGGSVLASSESGTENAPQLKSTVGGLADGVYDVFAYFWSDDDEDWRILAGLDSTNLVDFRRFSSQHAEADQFLAIDAVAANGNDLELFRAYLGRTEVQNGSTITAFIDDWQSPVGSAIRTWYDGLGVALVSSAQLAGDFDLDGDVDGADLLVWQQNNSVGNLAEWKANFGLPNSSTASAAVVPEPDALAALFAGLAVQCGIRRRRSGAI